MGVIALLLASASLASSASTVRAQGRPGAFVDGITWVEEPSQDRALQLLDVGNLDLYTLPLRSATDIAAAEANPNLWTIEADSTHFDLLLNPVPVNESLAPGKFNPFALADVREAMNYLIDRAYIASVLAGGSVIPHAAIWDARSPEYARDALFFARLEGRYAYDPAFGRAIVFHALGEVPGVTYEGGQWRYFGSQIALSFLIRTEDIRRDIGNYVADRVESLGFRVDRTYGCGVICLCPPQACGPFDTGAWHVATEAWATPALVAWSDSDPSFYHAGGDGTALWTVYRPGWELSDVAGRLAGGRYANLTERKAIVERSAELALRESVRVWIGSGAIFVGSKRVTGLVHDLAGGLWSPLTARTARFATPGGGLQVGTGVHLISPWNPWRGFGWLYDAIESYALTDTAIGSHPHTGVAMPLRADYAVYTAGPDGTLAVPTDAQVWDNATMAFTAVPAGTRATSVLNWTLTFGTWHDGEPFDMYDVLYELALVYRRASSAGDVHAKDADAAGPESSRLAAALKAFRVTGPDTVSFYLDAWHPDPGVTAAVANPAFPTTPWTASELAMATVLGDTCRVSELTAGTEGKDALDLSKGTCVTAMDGYVAGFISGGHEPPGLGALFPDAETNARWPALQAFRNTYAHYFASNGPFLLSEVIPNAPAVVMARDPNYPFAAARYDAALTPRIPGIAFRPPPQVVPGLAANFTIDVTLAGAPYDDVAIDDWVASDSGEVRSQGSAVRVAPGTFVASLTDGQTGSMTPGVYGMHAVAVGADAAVPVFSEVSFEVISVARYLDDVLHPGYCAPELCDPFSETERDLRAQENATALLRARIAAMTQLAYAAVAVAVGAVAVLIAILVLVLRRGRTQRVPPRRGPT